MRVSRHAHTYTRVHGILCEGFASPGSYPLRSRAHAVHMPLKAKILYKITFSSCLYKNHLSSPEWQDFGSAGSASPSRQLHELRRAIAPPDGATAGFHRQNGDSLDAGMQLSAPLVFRRMIRPVTKVQLCLSQLSTLMNTHSSTPFCLHVYFASFQMILCSSSLVFPYSHCCSFHCSNNPLFTCLFIPVIKKHSLT